MSVKFHDKAEPVNGPEASYQLVTYFEFYRDITTRIVRPARPGDIEAYPDEYAAYQKTRSGDDTGFPLVAWPGADEAVRLGLADRGIRTVEGLVAADLSAAPVEFRDAQQRGRQFLDTIRADAPRLASEIQELQADNAGLRQEAAELRAEIERLTRERDAAKAAGAVVSDGDADNSDKPRRGRPPKARESGDV